MQKIKLIILLILFGCTKSSKVTYFENGQIGIYPENAHIKEANESIWHVGPGFRQQVHKGIRLTLQFPHISLEDLKKINELKDINSFLVRVKRSNNDGQQILGLFEIPFKTGRSDDQGYIHELKSTSFGIYYADASMSLRFEKMMCPPMGTQKILTRIEVEDGEGETPGHILIDRPQEEYIADKVHEFNFYSMVINGGRGLLGTYQFEMCFYNNATKKKMSSFYKIPGKIKILGEQEKPIKGCGDFRIPPKTEEKGIKDIKFGRP